MEHPFLTTVHDIVGVTIAAPGAGTNLSFPCPVNARILPVHLSFVFTTDANVMNRLVQVAMYDGGNNYNIGEPTNVQAASTVRNYFFNHGIANARDILGGGSYNQVWCDLNPNCWLRFGDSIVTVIGGLQATDAITGAVIRYYQQIIPTQG